MDITLFLAKALGLYLLIVGLAMLFNAGKQRALLTDLVNNPSLLYLTGFIALIIGILLVLSHNIWVKDWPVVITILAWLSLIKGIVRVSCPQFALKTTRAYLEKDAVYYTCTVIIVIVGLFLCYKGFF